MSDNDDALIYSLHQHLLVNFARCPKQYKSIFLPRSHGKSSMAQIEHDAIYAVGGLNKITKSNQPIISWRWWKLTGRGILKSISSDHVWKEPIMTTKLDSFKNPMKVSILNPIEHGGINYRDGELRDWGVYSYKTPEFLFIHNPSLAPDAWHPLMLGRIKNTGHIVEHEFGYRAQKSEILELWAFCLEIPANAGPWLRTMKGRYKCEIHLIPFSRLKGWIKYYSDTGETENE